MPGVCTLGDLAKVENHPHGGPCCPHVCVGPAISASANVNVNGKPALRQGDLGIHSACCGPNMWKVIQASGAVFINGSPMVRQGDKTLHCNITKGQMITASANVVDGSPLGQQSFGPPLPVPTSAAQALFGPFGPLSPLRDLGPEGRGRRGAVRRGGVRRGCLRPGGVGRRAVRRPGVRRGGVRRGGLPHRRVRRPGLRRSGLRRPGLRRGRLRRPGVRRRGLRRAGLSRRCRSGRRVPRHVCAVNVIPVVPLI
jgi:uncharacterized Zn-binding protein involved in type VI secretion